MPNENIKLNKRNPKDAANYWKQLAINYLIDVQTLSRAMIEIEELVQKGRYYRIKSLIERAMNEISK